jgi:hypothetical protein
VVDFLPMPAQYANFSFVVLTFGLTLAIYFAFRYQVNFWWLNFWYSLPFFGKLARLSKDATRSSIPGWLRGEETLCADYCTHITTTSEGEFRKRLVYMRKAQDLGRKPLPGWMVVILATLLVAEGLGFSYLFDTWIAREGSANVQTSLTLAIVLVICTILVVLTDAAGHQLYRTGLIRRSDKEWHDHGQQGDFRSVEVTLDDDQVIDDRASPYTQTVNRIGTTGGYAIVGITVAAIVAIAGISTWMHVSHLGSKMIHSTLAPAATSSEGDPFATGAVPAQLTRPQQEADVPAKAQALSSEKSKSLASFIMLAIIFIVTQIVSIYAGFKYGFGGKESEAAFKGTRGLSTYDDYMDRVEPMVQAAQARLQTLQRNLSALGGNIKLNLHKTFDDYTRESEARRPARRKASANTSTFAEVAGTAIEIKRLGEVDKTREGYHRIAYKKTGNSSTIVEALVLVAVLAYFAVCTYAVIT